jgi:hypothetical protein
VDLLIIKPASTQFATRLLPVNTATLVHVQRKQTLTLHMSHYACMRTQMGRLLKAGHSIDVRHLQQLSQRRRWSFVVAAVGAASLAVGALMGAWGMANLNAAIANRSAAEPGVLQLAYRK